MSSAKSLRLDHYLFRARLFKSRSKATDACRQGRVLVNDKVCKASSVVNCDDLLKIREKGLYKYIRILELPGKNMSKNDAKTTWQDETPEETKQSWELTALAQRSKGPRREGARPTKKERRNLDKIRDNNKY